MMWGLSGMMMFMVLGWLLLVVALVAGAWWLVRTVAPHRRDDAVTILRERYARGAISREEYESRRRDLAA